MARKIRRVNSRLSKAEGRKAISWFLRKMGLQDWQVELEWSSRPPPWMKDEPGMVGCCRPDLLHKEASMWIASDRHHDEGMLTTVFHECGHIFLGDIAQTEARATPQEEFALLKLAELCSEAYLAGV